MNKKLIALAVAGVISGYGAAANAATTVSGFAVVDYVLTKDASGAANGCTPTASLTCNNSSEGKFGAEGEVDVIHQATDSVTVRMDVDLSLAGTDGAADSADLEQVFFAWDLAPVTLIAGVFNNPIGQEAEDSADWNFVTESMIRSALDNQTALHGNNVAGLAVAGAVGPVTLTGALLNHISSTNNGNEENSIALVANYSPVPGLDLELGTVTQESETDGITTVGDVENVGDVMNFNAQYALPMVAGLTVGLDYATFDEIVDTSHNLWAQYAIPNTKFSVGVRLEELSWVAYGGATAANEVERTSFTASYKAANNLKIALEVSDGDGAGCLASAPAVPAGTGCNLDHANANAITGVSTDAMTKLKFVATF